MQQDHKGNQDLSHHYQQGSQMIYQQQQLQPTLSSQVSLMQGQVQARPVYQDVNSPIRSSMIIPRMPRYSTGYMTSGYDQAQPTEVTSDFHGYNVSQQGSPYMQQNGMPPYSYPQVGFQPQARTNQYTQQQLYFIGTNYPGNVQMAPQIYATQSQPMQSHTRQPQVLLANHHTQPMMHQQPQSNPPPAAVNKGSTAIKLVDPKTGEDKTREVFGKKPTPDKPIPQKSRKDEEKEKVCAQFAAQVAETLSRPPSSMGEQVTLKPGPNIPAEESESADANKIEDVAKSQGSSGDVPTVKEADLKVAEKDIKTSGGKVSDSEINDRNSTDDNICDEGNHDDKTPVELTHQVKADPHKVQPSEAVVVPVDSDARVSNPPVEVEAKVVEEESKKKEVAVDLHSLKDNKESEKELKVVYAIGLEGSVKSECLESENVIAAEKQVETIQQVESLKEEEVPESVKVEAVQKECAEEVIKCSTEIPVESSPSSAEETAVLEVEDSKKNNEDAEEVSKELEKEKIPKKVETVAKESIKKNESVENKKSIKIEKPVNQKAEIEEKVAGIDEPKEKAELSGKENNIKRKVDKKDQSKTKEGLKNVEVVSKTESRTKSEPSVSENSSKVETKHTAPPSELPKEADESSVKNEVKAMESTKKLETLKMSEPSRKDSESSKKSEPSRKDSESSKKSEPSKKDTESSKKSEPSRKDSADSLINGHDDSVKSTAPVAKKKRGKNRFKDFESKESGNNLLSAFVDAPVEPAVEIPPEPVKPVEKPQEEPTWEDKEISIEKEDLHGDEAGELGLSKSIETKAVSLSNPGKPHQYERDFLLKFQYSALCTSKPDDLPDIDIVLDEAHAPTEALNPFQKITASNDFMPTFMRQSSGGRASASGRGKDRRGGSQSSAPRAAKVINIPQFEKIELKKTENEWVRLSEKSRNLSAEEKADFELNRNVCSILNKLTPQKFKPLVDQMKALDINNQRKLEKAISLIFEKAISEPGFSVAYANMCRVLTHQFDNVPATNQPANSNGQVATVTFRKILLNKCQNEFEKENKDEKTLEVDRAKVFETEAERKLWLEELDYRELMNRRRMLGNVRFIGELYKLSMISENIMHSCIYKLLKAEKQDSLEDQLECLCKLLTTIGKGLDNAKSKALMDQYFDQMKKLVEKRKISSRIRFALKDVMDLRAVGWVPRRDEGNPKTIDQIHKEAQEKEKINDLARQQEKLQRKVDPKSARGGRDSPSVRLGGQSSDGWSTMTSRNNRSSAPIDASKFKIQKPNITGISLGPGSRPGAWSQGASGGGTRTGSGTNNTLTSELEKRGTNRYDILSESSVGPGSLDRRPGSRTGMTGRKGSSGQSSGRKEEQISAVRAVMDMTGRSSRNQSPARSSGRSSRNQSPARSSSRNQSPAPSGGDSNYSNYSSRGAPVTYSAAEEKQKEKQMRKVTKSTIEEYLSAQDAKEASLCIKELESPGLHKVFVEEAITVVIEKKPGPRRMVASLLHKMMNEHLITVEQMCQGLSSIVELAPDFAYDSPFVYKYLGEVLGPIVFDGTLPLNKVKDTLEPLIPEYKAGIVMAEALSTAVAISGKEDLIASLWAKSKITWDMLLNEGEDFAQFIKDKKMEFTLQRSSLSHASQIQEEIQRILRSNQKPDNNNDNELISFIEEKFSKEEIKEPKFIQQLTKAVCSSSIFGGEPCECNRELLRKSKKVLLRYIDSNKSLELHALYALQQLVHELKQPRGLLRSFFEELYEGDIIREETFFNWEESKECPVGKGAALSSVKDFLSFLKKAEEESNDEESATSPTNVV